MFPGETEAQRDAQVAERQEVVIGGLGEGCRVEGSRAGWRGARWRVQGWLEA